MKARKKMRTFEDAMEAEYEREMMEGDHMATPSEAVAEFGYNAGMDYPDRAWLLHDFDVWVANPHYVGPPVPHPEEHPDDYDPMYMPGELKTLAPRDVKDVDNVGKKIDDDDIPF